MREFIGHTIKVAVESLGFVEGTMVEDKPTMILVKGKDGKITRIIKAHICGFHSTDFEPYEYVPFHVLYCENKRMKCPGVQYVKEGEGFNRNDVEVFVGPCPCRSDDCTMGTKGELRSVSGKFLREMIGGTMFGDYPKKEKANGNTEGNRGKLGLVGEGKRNTGGDAEAAKGKGNSRGLFPTEKPDYGGDDGTPEST